MKTGAAAITLAILSGSSWALADDKNEAIPESNTATVDAGPAPTTEVAGNGEIVLDNAAVNRAFSGGEIERPAVPLRPHRFGVYFGLRVMNLKNTGYDPYSDSDALVQNAIGFTFAPWHRNAWSLHLGAEWNLGAANSYVRGSASNLLVNRIALGLEGRWMPKSRFYLYAKVVPSLMHFGAEINDYELGATLSSSSWAFLVDTAAGAAVRLGTAGKEPKRTASFWLMMDWGYTFAGSAAMTFRPSDITDTTRQFGAVNLPALRPNGFVTRAAFGLTF